MAGNSGPLAGPRVLDVATLAPGAFGAMMLADLGADVIRIDRGDGKGPGRNSVGSPTSSTAAVAPSASTSRHPRDGTLRSHSPTGPAP